MAGLLAFSRFVDSINGRIGRFMSWAILAAVAVSSINATIRYAFSMSSNAWLEMQWYLFSAVFLMGASWTLQQNQHIRIDIVNSRLSRRVRNVIEVTGHLVLLLPFAGLLVWLGIPNAWRSFSSTGVVTLEQIGFFLALMFAGVLLWAGATIVPRLWMQRRRAGPATLLAGVIVLLLAIDLVVIRNLAIGIMPLWEQSSSAGGLPTWPARFLIPLGFLALFLQGLSELIKRIAIIRGLVGEPGTTASGVHGEPG